MTEASEAKAALSTRDFNERPFCAHCGSDNQEHFLTVYDTSTLVRCRVCTLVYTSPRLEERLWQAFLKDESNSRNKEFTDNRLQFGVALKHNVHKQTPNWRAKLKRRNVKVVNEIKSCIERPLSSMHDVGCGVGFLLIDARNSGLQVSGNDLNGYACTVMRERYGLDVRLGAIHEIDLEEDSQDAVTMTDYIEHTYHPLRDLREAYRITRLGGALYIHTFRIDSEAFRLKGRDWSMLAWNHVYHFSTETLTKMVEAAGFSVAKVVAPNENAQIAVTAVKRQ